MKRKHSRWHLVIGWTGLVCGVGMAVLVLSFIAVDTWPAIGAQGADLLRRVIGDKAVAGLEMKLFQVQDEIQKIKYQMGLETPAAPWEIPQAITPVANPATLTPEPVPSTQEVQTQASPEPDTTLAAINSPTPTIPPTAAEWQPSALTPLSKAAGEGLWSDYIQDMEGHSVALRTFLQPDPTRPYTLVAIVAFDLTRTRLHFVLGSEEPAGENTQPRSGSIPQADKVGNVLLAAFNGGFQARHGHFGAMADNIMALPPREGLGTLMIYRGGRVSLEEWKSDWAIPSNMVAFRQNGPLVIQEAQINSRIHNNSPQDWGYTVYDVSPTVRSGVGLSKDGKTLFYFCGPSLSMENLAISMQAAGAWNAIQLDINDYWALFVKFQATGSKLIPEVLLPRFMVANVERYLWNNTRDFFYVTSIVR